MILCEYSHAMGNSNGSLGDYWDAFETHHGLQGGFIWEWCDHALVKRGEDGREHLAYGGDFGDTPNDLNFCCDGIVSAYREPHPALWEFKKLAQPVAVTWADAAAGRIEILSKRDFTDLSDLGSPGRWTLTALRSARASSTVRRLRPANARQSPLPLPRPTIDVGQEAHLMVRLHLRDETPYAPAGHEVAWEQLPVELPVRAAVARAPARTPGPLRLEETGGRIVVAGDGFEARLLAHRGATGALRLAQPHPAGGGSAAAGLARGDRQRRHQGHAAPGEEAARPLARRRPRWAGLPSAPCRSAPGWRCRRRHDRAGRRLRGGADGVPAHAPL